MATTFSLAVDWDHNGTWSDESAYVRRVQVRTGFAAAGDLVADVGRCVITLENTSRRFSPGNAQGPLYGKLLPRRAVRVQASTGVQTWTLFRGFIERIEPDAGSWGAGDVRITCVDAIALLARQRISVAHAESKAVSAAVGDIVSAVYTPPATDYIDNGDTLEHYGRAWQPEATTAHDALRDIAAAVYGRFYIARDGTAVFVTRDQLQNAATPAVVTVGDALPVPYYQRVLAASPDHLLGYWPLWEDSGILAEDQSGHARDGLASGVTWGALGIGDGRTAALFDAVNDYVNLYLLASAFNGAAGTLLLWAKAAPGSTAIAPTLFYAAADANNYVRLDASGAAYCAGGVSNTLAAAFDLAAWHCLALAWDAAAGSLALYLDGTLQASANGLGTWAGTLAVALIGAGSTTPSGVWDGWIAHVALWDVALEPGAIAALAEVDA